jgi:uncharacterized protein YkwD
MHLIKKVHQSMKTLNVKPTVEQPSPGPVNGANYFLTATNAARVEAGLSPLAADARLMQAAQAHADNMATQDKYGDTDTNGHYLDGHDVVYRVAQVGYDWSWLGENVAYCFGFNTGRSPIFSGGNSQTINPKFPGQPALKSV